jgi:hypothetical protein
MADSLDVKLLRRQLGDKRKHTSIKTFYGDRAWVNDLDIINELGGHTGCVNALRCVTIASLNHGLLLTSSVGQGVAINWPRAPMTPS